METNNVNLTRNELAILEELNDMWKWIARDENGNLYLFTSKPQKDEDGYWYYYQPYRLSVYNRLFPFIKWEDEEPCLIADLIEQGRKQFMVTSESKQAISYKTSDVLTLRMLLKRIGQEAVEITLQGEHLVTLHQPKYIKLELMITKKFLDNEVESFGVKNSNTLYVDLKEN